MLLGKRGGGAIIRRTSSMSGMNIDLDSTETHQELPSDDPMMSRHHHPMVSPRYSNIAIDTTPHFLRTCRLCNRRLAPGQDIYMYRGDTAFCSLECREEQMKQDERKDKWNKVTSKKQQDSTSSSTSTSKASTKTHTVVAA
ncbi:FCS-Like Zinc finger 3-like [Prosopis cineraria]|uniref:FCS-Like Zinc finger 3-like n=1 Tax=Prosopis cineraria TaxID=364024 RepID=UPI00240F56DB|nr:FCS-Like Zinc finger 3-like [Prosopis cineraria]